MADYNAIEKETLDRAKKYSGDYSTDSSRLTDATIKQIQDAVNAASAPVTQGYNEAMSATASGYGNLIQANQLQNAIAKQSVANTLSRMGISEPVLNRTENTALEIGLGNANNEALARQSSAEKALDQILALYQAQRDADKTAANAGVKNQMTGAALGERTSGFNNALSTAGSLYNQNTEIEAQQAQRAEAERQASLRLQDELERERYEQKIAIDKAYKKLEDEGLIAEEPVNTTPGESVSSGKSGEIGPLTKPKERNIWDDITFWDTANEKSRKKYGQTSEGRQEALEDKIIEIKDMPAHEVVSKITGGYYPKGQTFEEALDKYLNKSNLYGNKFDDEEKTVIKQYLASELKEAKKVYNVYKR